ncbi:MAG TPA: ABC transporter permease [Polyangiaceae bacterium]|nr:ABC transporter permease [Polyangiaceae bacterium]
MLSDIRFALRLFARSPFFAAAVVLVLGLGVGASTTVFTLVDAYLVKPLPFPEPERVVTIWSTRSRDANDRGPMSVPDLVDLTAQARSFSHLAAIKGTSYNLSGGGRADASPESVEASRVGAAFFPLLGVAPALGRAFTPDEDTPGRDQVVVLSDGLFRRRFNSDPGVIGRTVTLDGKPYQIVGVMPPSFRMPVDLRSSGPPDLWVPAAFSGEGARRRDWHSWNLLGRLAPGVSLAAARADLDAVARRLEEAYPATNASWTFHPLSLHDYFAGPVRPSLTMLFVATLLLLVIASANVALLLLARASAREGEVAVRAALGADGSRLVRQFLVESTLLALFGGAVGYALSFVGVGLVAGGYRGVAHAAHELRPDGRVLAFSLALASLAGLGFGLVPALRASKARLYELLKGNAGRATAGAGGRRLQGALLVAEVALSAVLLAGSAAVARGFYQTLNQPLGFDPSGTLTFTVHLPPARYPDAESTRRLSDALLERLRALPSVRAAGIADTLPLTDSGPNNGAFEIEGRPPAPEGQEAMIEYRLADGGYFSALRLPLRSGRLFTEADRTDSAPVVIVNETFARRYFPGENPVGKRIRWTLFEQEWREIVGVVADLRDSAAEPGTKLSSFVPFAQAGRPNAHVSFALRTAGDPRAVANAVRDEVGRVDADMPLIDVRTFEELATASLADRRFTLVLVAAFALSALLLTALGLFGLVSYQTRRRSRELAIRMALGAAGRDVRRLVLRDTSRLLAAGLLLGLPAAFASGRLLAAKLEGIPPTDPLSLAATALLLGLVALAAVLAPARRAARTPPALVLRDE